jgi:hypothetical protein
MAICTDSARNKWIQHYLLPHLLSGYNHSRGLMSKYQRRYSAGIFAVIGMHIGATNAYCINAD